MNQPTRPLLIHSTFVENNLPLLSTGAQYVFATACCQRLLRIVIASGPSEHIRAAKLLLENSWSWLAGLNDDYFENDHFFSNLDQSWSALNDERLLVPAVHQFTRLELGLNGELNEIGSIGYWNTALLDNFLYQQLGLPVNSEHDRIIDSHRLMQQEIERQQRDIRRLLAAVNTNFTARELWRACALEDLLVNSGPMSQN